MTDAKEPPRAWDRVAAHLAGKTPEQRAELLSQIAPHIKQRLVESGAITADEAAPAPRSSFE